MKKLLAMMAGGFFLYQCADGYTGRLLAILIPCVLLAISYTEEIIGFYRRHSDGE